MTSTISPGTANCTKSTVPSILANALPSAATASMVTFSKMIKREDELIDWNDTSRNIHNKVRAYYPSPCAYTLIDDVSIKILKGSVSDKVIEGEVGEIVLANKEGIFVRAKDGVYKIEKLQASGKKPMDSRDYLNGNKDLVGKKCYVR